MADLSKYTPEEFEAYLRNTPVSPKNTITIDDPQLADTVMAANRTVQAQLPRDYVHPENKRMGQRPGVFLDINKGADAGTRFKLGLDENQLNQFKFLVERYGAGNVDISDEGQFVLRNQPSGLSTGGTEDILVDPVGAEWSDAAQMGGQIIPMVAGAFAGRLGLKAGSTGMRKALYGLLAGALGTEVTGGAQDAYVRWTRGNDVDVTDIAKKRAQMAGADLAFGAVLAGGAKVGLKVAEAALGLAYIPVGQTRTKLAQQALLKRTGVDFKLTPGMEAESDFLMRVESMAEARPGSAGVMTAVREAESKAVDELRRVFLGLPRTMSDDEVARVLPQADIVGQHGLQRLRNFARGLEAQKDEAVEAIQRTGTAEAQQLAGVNIASAPDVPPVGQALRSRATREFDEFRSAMGEQYEEFLSRPEIRARTVKADDLAASVKRIEGEFVPAARKGAVTQPLESFVQPKFRSFVDELKSLKGRTVSVNDLKRVRTAIDNSIKEGIAIPGTDVAQLESLRESVDNAITSALKGMDPLPSAYADTAPLTIWNKLKADYATGMSRFNRTGIRELLVNAGEKGSIGDTRIIGRALGASDEALDNYNAYKDFLGTGSTEWKAFQDIAKQDALFGSIDDLSGYISGAKLRSRLSSDSLRPEIAADLFGTSKQELHQIGEILKQASARNIDADELAKLARSNSLTAGNIQRLLDAEQELTRAYNNKLIRAAAKGAIDAEAIKPSEFVRHVSNMDPDEAAKVLGALGDVPELRRDIRQIAVEDVLDRMASGATGLRKLEASLLDDVLRGGKAGQEGEVKERTWRLLLDDNTVNGLRDLLTLFTTRERIPAKVFGSGIAGANDLAQIALHGEAGALKQLAARWALAVAYTGPLARSITNLFTKRNHGQVMSALITSEPFVNATIDRFGTDGALLVMRELRDMIEPIQRNELMVQGQLKGDPSTLTPEQFEEWLSNRNPLEAVPLPGQGR